MTAPEPYRIDLVRPLAARLQPAVALLAALLAAGAPLAHHGMGVLELRTEGAALAARAADVLAEEAQYRPLLWRYDSIKLVEHLRAYRLQRGVAALAVIDAAGRAVDASEVRRPRGAVLWASAPARVHGQTLATVWVAIDLRGLRARSLALLVAFCAIAVGLGVAVSRSALGSARGAEGRIGALLAELARLTTRLEGDVQARTADLAAANAALRDEERRLRETSARALALQESERRAIARDLHDSVGQALTAIRIHAQLLAADGVAEASLAQVLATTDGALEELRRALARLGPAAVAEVGLASAVERLVEALDEGGETRVTTAVGALGELAPAVEVAAYRIVQEALTNALRHAAARTVVARLARDGDALVVEVRDDGRGYDAAGARTGSGVAGMRERAELLRGTLTVERADGGGTRVLARLPCTVMPAG